MEATQVSIDRWMDKEDVVHIYNGTLLSHKKEQIWISSSEADEPKSLLYRVKSEREKHILYINAYIWNLEKMLFMNLSAGKEWRCRYREQTCGHTGERVGWYTTVRKVDSGWEVAT